MGFFLPAAKQSLTRPKLFILEGKVQEGNSAHQKDELDIAIFTKTTMNL